MLNYNTPSILPERKKGVRNVDTLLIVICHSVICHRKEKFKNGVAKAMQ